MNVRWTGEGDRELADPQVTMPHGEWVDLPAEVARSLAKQDDFELEAPKKAAKTRAEHESADTEPATPADDEKES